jgi:mono/diheme cytochrome c family protein
MRVRARTIILGFLGLLLVLVIAAISAVGWQIVLGPKARPVTARTFAASEARRARGKYLVEGVAACFHCHSDHDFRDPEYPVIEGRKGAGWSMPIPELGTVVAPNITPDAETGIGTWTDDEIARAIQEGIAKDGHALFPVMPYLNFRNLVDEDLASIVVYLRSIPPVRNVVPPMKLIFPLSLLVKTMPVPMTAHVPAPPRTTAEARGEYLVRTVASCQDCHTTADDKGLPLPGMEFGGGNLFHDPGQGMKAVFPANITQDPSGIAHYDEAMFIETMHAGQVRGRVLSHIMPFENFKNMTDADLSDMWAYLKVQPLVKHRISNTDPPTMCPVCNHEHGLGNLNVKKIG